MSLRLSTPLRLLLITAAVCLPWTSFASVGGKDEAEGAGSTDVTEVNPADTTTHSARERLVSLFVGGDVTLGHHIERMFDEQLASGAWTQAQADAYLFDEIREVTASSDIFLLNLEAPFTSRGEPLPKNFNFRASPEWVSVLVDGGVDVVSLANNHTYDFGDDGLFDTLTTLRAHRMPYFGAGADLRSARAPAIVERFGVKVAFLGYFYLDDRNIEPPQVYAAEGKPGVAGCYRGVECIGRMVEEDVRAARELADVVVPYFHWGREGQFEVMPYQRELARRAIDAGAGLVLGAHPHVVHGVEVYRGVPIVYSLGNFVFGGNWNPRVQTTVAADVRLSKRGVEELYLLPIRYTNPPDRRFQPRFMEGEEAEAVIDDVARLSAIFEETIPLLRDRKIAPKPVPGPEMR